MVKEKLKVGRPRKTPVPQDGFTVSVWNMGLDSPLESKDSKITFYFTRDADHTYSKKLYHVLGDADVAYENVQLTVELKKKSNEKSALTLCSRLGNAQNTVTTVASSADNTMRKKTSVKPTGHSQGKKVPEQNGVRSKQLTDYFPVRRSVRKTLVTLKKEKQMEIEERILSGREDGYEVQEFIGKGRGVVSINPVERGEFVLEYSGDLISVEEAKRREYIYSHDENIGCYMYYFTYKNRQYCVDATRETGRLGRLVNHSKKSNLKTKTVLVQDIPRLILVAERDISPGEELLYDYGDRSKRSLESHPWLAS